MKKRMLTKSKVFALATVTFLVVVSISSVASNDNAESKNICESGKCGVTNSQIVTYLQGYGYSNIILSGIPGGCDVIADTDYSYDTRVFCTETEIIGHEDIPTK